MAKSKLELGKLIRFGIEQLSPQNGQMDFEHICRQFARSRIHVNILPATGPVQSGGDQGRDFETFHSYMANSPIAQTSFVGLFSEHPVAFACSLQKDPIKSRKIDRDVSTILGSGMKVERIYFFSGQDISVADRHKCQNRILTDKGVALEIIDATALSEHLSDPDLFWIASRYLDIPNDYYPVQEDTGWYAETKAAFKAQEESYRRPTFEEFSEIKSALRRIYKDDQRKVDLPFWLQKIQLYLAEEVFRPLQRKAIYEQFVAKLIGQNDISGQEKLVRNYFSDFQQHATPAALEDATMLLSFTISSKSIIGHSIPDNEIAIWQDKLWYKLETEYANTSDAGKKIWLAAIRAHFQFQIVRNSTIEKGAIKFINIIKEATPYFNDALFYPFEELSKFLNHILERLLQIDTNTTVIEDLEEVARLVDEEIGKRYGEMKAGDRLKIRALQYYKNGLTLKALDAFHRVKSKWTNADSPQGIILTALLISQCYNRLNMHYASRYYAFAVAHIAVNSDDSSLLRYLPKGLRLAANASYMAGAWLSYVDTLDLCIQSNQMATKDFNLYEESEENISIVAHPATIMYVIDRFNLNSRHLFNHRFARLGYIGDEINEMKSIVKERVDVAPDNQLFSSFEEQFSDRVFNDLGPQRVISFRVYGSKWSISFINDYETNAAAEQFVAIIQLLLTELNDSELYLIRSEVKIDFLLRSGIVFPEQEVLSSQKETKWKLSFPTDIDSPSNVQGYYAAITTLLIQEISLLNSEQLMKIIHQKYDSGELLSRLLFSNTYQFFYKEFISQKEFDESLRHQFSDSHHFMMLAVKDNVALPWNDSIAPSYNQSASLQAARNRMSFLYPYEITLPKLKESPSFLRIVHALRKNGWLDWQIAQAVGNNIVNYKIKKTAPIYDPAEALSKASEYFYRPESEWYIPIPESVTSFERIEWYLNNELPIIVLQSFGLTFNSGTPNTPAVLELLSKRFNFLTDGSDINVFE